MKSMKVQAIVWTVILLLHVLVQPIAAFADGTDEAHIQLTMSSNESRVPSGQPFTYTIQYSVSSNTVNSFGNAKIQVHLPAQVLCDKTINDSRTSSACPGGNTPVVFQFDSPLPAGATGTLQVDAKFPNYTTPNGTTAVASSEFISSQVTKTSNSVTVTATASAAWELTKKRTSPEPEPLQGGQAVYTLTLTDKTASKYGRLELNDIKLTDALPAGATCLSAAEGACDKGDRLASWAIRGPVRDSKSFSVKVQYDPTISGTVVNNVYGEATPLGEAPIHLEASVSHGFTGLSDLGVQGVFSKAVHANQQEISPGQDVTFFVGGFRNRANDKLHQAEIVDLTPADLRLKSVKTAKFENMDSVSYDVYYTLDTGNSRTWTLWDSVSANGGQLLDASVLPGQVSGVKFVLGDVPINFSQESNFEFVYNLPSAFPVPSAGAAIENKAELTYSFAGKQSTATSKAKVKIVESRPLLEVKKLVKNGYYFNPENTVKYGITVTNTVYSSDVFHDPVVYDLLPAQFDYVDNSAVVDDAELAMPAAFTAIRNYNGSGRTLLLWKWQVEEGNSAALPIGKSLDITFDVKIKPHTPTGIIWNRVEVLSKRHDYLNDYNFKKQAADTDDHDGDGKTADDKLIYEEDDIYINAVTNLDSVKWVHGELDFNADGSKVWTKYPGKGTTTPGGTADYKLVVANSGNKDVKDVVIVDVLPRIGDKGVVVGTARESRWRPALTDAVMVPGNMKVYYSTDTNVSMTDGSWTQTLPADMTTVTAIKFVLQEGVILKPGEAVELVWTMRAPVGAPTNGEIAWNSFGYQAARVDDNSVMLAAEPNKVGIKLQANPKAELGDYVWFDENANGLADEDASHGVNGVLVKLFNQDGTLLQSTVTSNNFNNHSGYYLFSNLKAGSYYVQFERPAGYDGWTNALQGSDRLIDSDVSSGGRTGIVVLAAGERNVSVDAGLRIKRGDGGSGSDSDDDNDQSDGGGEPDGSGTSGGGQGGNGQPGGSGASGGGQGGNGQAGGTGASGGSQGGNGQLGGTGASGGSQGGNGQNGGTGASGGGQGDNGQAGGTDASGGSQSGNDQAGGTDASEGNQGRKQEQGIVSATKEHELAGDEGKEPSSLVPNAKKGVLPQTGEAAPLAPWIGVLLCGAALLLHFRRRLGKR